MRIIAGEARGNRIRLPGGCRIRPTADRIKKSLFDILRPVTGKFFLDLFAGSGNVGLEALSQGARHSVFVEKDIRLVKAIRAALDGFRYDQRAEVIAADVGRGLRNLVQRGERFDIVFADPPYDMDLAGQTLRWLETGDVLKENGMVVLQHSVREKLEETPDRALVIADQRQYGDTMLTFLHHKIKEDAHE
jgi:16S rRNA (guanine(966)-N(2))-methyltransferase RsmD